jgi:hypothetical protein
MLNAVEGVFRDGKIELLEVPSGVQESRVIVTFVPPTSVDLRSHGIDETQAAGLRGRLRTFAEDWDRPEMDVYDDRFGHHDRQPGDDLRS